MTAVYQRFLSFRRIPLKIVIITALASWALQIGAIVQGQPLYVIVFFTILPWIPLAFFESIWKYKHYHWIAIFAIITVLQIGHYGEHLVQVSELAFANGTLSCPPPPDSAANAQRALDNGYTRQIAEPTGYTATSIAKFDQSGQPATDANGNQIIGPPACGVFGQFDFEPIHLVWDTLVWIGGLVLLTRFPRNAWLWIAVIFASLHEVEHLFLGWIYLIDTAKNYSIMGPLWATVTEGGRSVTAYPVGKEPMAVDFYHAGGLSGIMGRGGLVENLFGLQGILPIRPYLHFIYNSLVVIPTVIAFLVQSRQAYDEYLAEALPPLTEEQLIRTTPKLEQQKYGPGEIIIRQNDFADKFYIITKGQVEVLREQDGQEIHLSRLRTGDYFGEIGLLHGGKRTATVRATDNVEVLTLDRNTFNGLIDESDLTRQEVDRLARRRVREIQEELQEQRG